MFKRKAPDNSDKQYLGISGGGMSFNSNLKRELIARNILMFERSNNMKKVSEKTGMKITLISCLLLVVIVIAVLMLDYRYDIIF
jgi:hypothetical protein